MNFTYQVVLQYLRRLSIALQTGRSFSVFPQSPESRQMDSLFFVLEDVSQLWRNPETSLLLQWHLWRSLLFNPFCFFPFLSRSVEEPMVLEAEDHREERPALVPSLFPLMPPTLYFSTANEKGQDFILQDEGISICITKPFSPVMLHRVLKMRAVNL